MTRALPGWLLVTVLLVLVPMNAGAVDGAGANDDPCPGSHCLGDGCAKLVLNQFLGGKLNPLGVEHRLELGPCLPLIRKPHMLFDFTNLRFGAINYVSPTYAHLGGFFAISPLSIVELRAEVSGLTIWPIPMSRTGYNAVAGYGAPFGPDDLPAGNGGSAWGVMAAFRPTLRARVGLGQSPLSLVVNDGLALEFWQVGDEAYYYNARRDVVLARKDWLLANTAIVALEIPVHPNATLMLGGMDDVVYVPASEYLEHKVSGLVSIRLDRLGKGMRDFQPFVTVGVYEQHAEFDNQIWIGIGIAAAYPLKVL